MGSEPPGGQLCPGSDTKRREVLRETRRRGKADGGEPGLSACLQTRFLQLTGGGHRPLALHGRGYPAPWVKGPRVSGQEPAFPEGGGPR